MMEEQKKGKNFSKNNQGQRRAGDFYQTPYSMTEHLVQWLKKRTRRINTVLEPACGEMAVVNVLMRHDELFKTWIYYDLDDGVNFLEETDKYDWIITNPPFTLSTEFIDKCKRVAKKGFALLMPIEYLHGKERYEKFYKEANGFPLTNVIVFTRRAMLTDEVRDDGKYDTGMVTWCWYVWERKPLRYNRPVIDWIDNDDDVSRKTRKKT